MTLGSLFLITFGADIVLKEIFYREEDPVGHPVKINTSLPKVKEISFHVKKCFILDYFIFRLIGF